ncbi:hypothetical protein [Phenylobacterium sp.]
MPRTPDEQRERRNRLVGRLLIVILGLLALAQVLPMLLRGPG